MDAKDFAADVEWRSPDALTPYVLNTKRHPTEQIDKIAASIAEFGFDQPIVVDSDGVIIKGHGRREAALRLKLPNVPVLVRSDLSPAQVKAARIADNKVAESDWDLDALKLELQSLDEAGFSLDSTGFSGEEIADLLALAPEDGAGSGTGSGAGSLAERFGVPPFSVLNAREGWWQTRKQAWIAIGIQSELGRGAPCLPADAQDGGSGFLIDAMRRDAKGRKANAVPGGAPMPATNYSKSGARGDGRGRAV